MTTLRAALLLALALPVAPAALAAAASDHSGHDAHADHGAPVYSAPPDVEPPSTPGSGSPTGGESSEHMGHEGGGDFWWGRLDQFEAVDSGDDNGTHWKGSLSWGGSYDRLWLASEGERGEDGPAALETQLYWSHAVAAFWDTTVGARVDNGPGDSQSWLAVGVRGLAPYWFETAATAFAGEGGQAAFRLDADYEVLLTNRLILQPEIEVDLYTREDAVRGQGEGLAHSRAGLRLRYELSRKFAPYVGVEWSRLHGRTEELAQARGERVHEASVVAGVRAWF